MLSRMKIQHHSSTEDRAVPLPRSRLIDIARTPFYHCVSRCVRRAHLCGKDLLTGRSFEHRRQWVENRLLLLSQIFAIDVCAFAVMHNHTHLVLQVQLAHAATWSDEEVLRRWYRLHKPAPCCVKFLDPVLRQALSQAELETVSQMVKELRERLSSISWFMRLLNEYIARKANKEDDCTGRFWEGRFKSQALLDEAAVAACMAYVDLNPIRAGIATSLETSDHTSIKYRLAQSKRARQLAQFTSEVSNPANLPIRWQDYLALLNLMLVQPTSKSRRPQQNPLLTKLSPAHWVDFIRNIESKFGNLISLPCARRKLLN